MLIYDAVITGSFSYNGVDISDVTSSEASVNALNQFTSSYNTGSFTGSFKGNGSGLNGVVSASFAINALTASYAANVPLTASFAISASQAQNAVSSSYSSNADLLDGKNSTEFAITGSNSFTGTQYITDTTNPTGFGTSAAVYTDGGLRVTKDAYVSGTIYVNNLSVFGTQSINYITSSQLNISTNIISVNTDTPFIRFGGLSVYDSGSTGLTGSILWDSERDHWIYSNPSGSTYNSGMLISGPRNSGSLGTEQGTLNNYIVKGQGGDHVTSSQIIDDGTTVRIPGNLQVTGSTIVTSNLRTDTGLGLKYGSFTSTSGYLNLFSALVSSTATLSLKDGTSGYESALNFPVSANRSYTFPNADGTIALTSNLSSYLPLTGGNITGNLTIGSPASALAQFHIYNASAAASMLVQTNSAADYAEIAARNFNQTSTCYYRQYSSSASGTLFGASASNLASLFSNFASNFAIGTLNGGDLILGTANTERMRITASTGAATFASSVTAAGFIATAADPYLIINQTTNSNNSGVKFQTSGNEIGKITAQGQNGNMNFNMGPSAGWGGYITFQTDTTERMRISSAGNISLGTADAPTKLNMGGYVGSRLPYIDGTSKTFNSIGITVGSYNSGNAIGGGLDLTNNVASVGAYSPILSFSSLSSNGAYNNAYAGIWGVYQGAGGDANWNKGDLVFGTALSYGINERMRIPSNGGVTINGALHVINTGTVFIIGEAGGSAKQLLVGIDGSTGTSELQSVWQGNSYTRLNLNPIAGAVYAGGTRLDTLSDSRVKDNIQEITGALDKVLSITGKKFHLKDEEESKIRYGFIAQELEGILDEFVVQTNMTFKKDDLEIENVKSIDNWASSWAALLVEAMKEQQTLITELQEKLERNNII